MSNLSPAEIYDQQFVPALFAHWGQVIAEKAVDRSLNDTIKRRVLDVACGTGVLAASVRSRVTASDRVTGIDTNEEMLSVARRNHTDIQWQMGSAENLPFADASYSSVVSQFGMMFFSYPVQALREMMRVLKPGGHLLVAVCDALDHSPGYATLVELLRRLFGDSVAEAFRAPFTLGDREKLTALVSQAGIAEFTISRLDGPVKFKSISELVATERACVWTLGGLLNDRQFALLEQAANESLQPFAKDDQTIEFNMPVLLVEARKPV